MKISHNVHKNAKVSQARIDKIINKISREKHQAPTNLKFHKWLVEKSFTNYMRPIYNNKISIVNKRKDFNY